VLIFVTFMYFFIAKYDENRAFWGQIIEILKWSLFIMFIGQADRNPKWVAANKPSRSLGRAGGLIAPPDRGSWKIILIIGTFITKMERFMKKNNALKSFFLNPGSGLPVGWNFDGQAEGAGGYGGVWATPVAFFEINLFKKKKKSHLQMASRPALRTIPAGHTTTPPTEI
jgi:hypothetical protein